MEGGGRRGRRKGWREKREGRTKQSKENQKRRVLENKSPDSSERDRCRERMSKGVRGRKRKKERRKAKQMSL